MNKKELEKEFKKLKEELEGIKEKIGIKQLSDPPREKYYTVFSSVQSYTEIDLFELKDVVQLILGHLGLKLVRTSVVPSTDKLEKVVSKSADTQTK